MAIRILGGEGANRFFGVLRSERGLTYGASAEFNAYRTSGVVVAETDTRTSGTGESLRLMVDEFARLQRDTVHPAELQGAQDFFAGHFPLSIETPSAIAEQVLTRLVLRPGSGRDQYVRGPRHGGDRGRHSARRSTVAQAGSARRSCSSATRQPSPASSRPWDSARSIAFRSPSSIWILRRSAASPAPPGRAPAGRD